MKKIKINDDVMRIIVDKKENSFCIITDRSRCSACWYLRILGLNTKSLIFMQARKSFFDFIYRKHCNVCDSGIKIAKRIKPDGEVYNQMVLFLKNKGVDIRKVFYIDDSKEARKKAEDLGLKVIDPADRESLMELTNP